LLSGEMVALLHPFSHCPNVPATPGFFDVQFTGFFLSLNIFTDKNGGNGKEPLFLFFEND